MKIQLLPGTCSMAELFDFKAYETLLRTTKWDVMMTINDAKLERKDDDRHLGNISTVIHNTNTNYGLFDRRAIRRKSGFKLKTSYKGHHGTVYTYIMDARGGC